MSLNVIQSGALTLLQDLGRYGLQKHGITQGGPLDEHAYLWANYLLDNHYNAPQLEITLGGFSARFTRATIIAVCGADLSATLNGQPLALWQSHAITAGDEIKFTSPKSGLRAYLAIKHGFEIDPQLSSCATVCREKLGGLSQNGKPISQGDQLAFKATNTQSLRYTPAEFIPNYPKANGSDSIMIRFIPNHSVTGCEKSLTETFSQHQYQISEKIDRMGYRLAGKAIPNTHTISEAPSEIISQGVSVGAIQLPKDGQPIVLMKDKQTMGGYPQLGCVAYLDLALLSQSPPGTHLKFLPRTSDQLEQELLEYKNFFKLPF